MFSVICVYNNKKALEDYLLKSINTQTARFELIAIDNTDNKFKSAASALNYGAGKATSKYLVFVHQDIVFSSNRWLADAEKILNSLPNLGVAGVAGRNTDRFETITNIKDDTNKKSSWNFHIDSPVKVQTVDECLTIIPKSVFDKLQFDKTTCDDWHLYVADYCLSIKKLGLNIFVIPSSLYHVSSGGSFSKKYFDSLRKVLKKHKKDYNLICTPYGRWSPYYPIVLQRVMVIIKFGIRSIWRRSGLKSF